MQSWSDNKANFSSPSQISRSLTPNLITAWRDEIDRTPERMRLEFNQTFNISHSPSFYDHRQSLLNTSFNARSPAKMSEPNIQNIQLEPKKPVKLNRPNQQLSKSISGATAAQLKTKVMNSQQVQQSPPQQQTPLTSLTNNENSNYLTQINHMLQKMNKMKAEIESSRERETDYVKKVSSLEKENQALHALIEEKERLIGEFQRRAKEDKSKLLQFVQEVEAYKEANAELQRLREEVGSQTKLSDTDSLAAPQKPVMISRGLQTIEDGPATCAKCAAAMKYCHTLTERLAEVDESSRQLMDEYTQLKHMLDQNKRLEEKSTLQKVDFEKRYNEFERKYTELQRQFHKQAKICAQVQAENVGIRSTLEFLSEVSSNESVKKVAPQQNDSIKPVKEKIRFMPAAFKALAHAEKISNAQQNQVQQQFN